MKPTKAIGESRKAELAPPESGAKVETRSVGAAMIDALEDILKYERASERTVKAAKAALN